MKKDFFSDRVREIFLRWKNECGKNKKKYLAGPYLFWSVSFTIIPLLMIFYYGLTDADGAFTFANIAEITTPENLKALGLALLLSLISTLICLILAYPLAMILANSNVNHTSFLVLILHPPNVDDFLLRTLACRHCLRKMVSSTASSDSSTFRRWKLLIRLMQSFSVWSIISYRSWYCQSTMFS